MIHIFAMKEKPVWSYQTSDEDEETLAVSFKKFSILIDDWLNISDNTIRKKIIDEQLRLRRENPGPGFEFLANGCWQMNKEDVRKIFLNLIKGKSVLLNLTGAAMRQKYVVIASDKEQGIAEVKRFTPKPIIAPLVQGKLE